MAEDIKINEAQQVQDAAYVTVLLEDGSLGKIPRNDLIELIRENMPESNSEQKGLASPVTPKHYNYYQVDCKLSDLTQNGYYYIDDQIYREDAPEGLTNYNLVVYCMIGITVILSEIVGENGANGDKFLYHKVCLDPTILDRPYSLPLKCTRYA